MLLKILIALLVIIARHSGTENPDHLFSSYVMTAGGGRPIEQPNIPIQNNDKQFDIFTIH